MADTVVSEDSFGCNDCWPPEATDAWEARSSLAEHATLVDDSHLGVRILTCPTCQQHFVSVFLEFVDWTDGDDPQYWTVLPLTAQEVAELAGMDQRSVVTRLNQLAPNRRCLQRDYPKGASVRVSWGHGIWIVR